MVQENHPQSVKADIVETFINYTHDNGDSFRWKLSPLSCVYAIVIF